MTIKICGMAWPIEEGVGFASGCFRLSFVGVADVRVDGGELLGEGG